MPRTIYPCPKCIQLTWRFDAETQIWRCHDPECLFQYINGQQYAGYLTEDYPTEDTDTETQGN